MNGICRRVLRESTHKDPRDGCHRPGAWPDPVRESNMPDRTCAVEDCGRPYVARGWCGLHYQRWYKYGDVLASTPGRPLSDLARCAVDDCGRVVRGNGLCSMHYQRWRLSGKVAKTERPTTQERFWAQVEKTATCWIWTGRINPCGYGHFNMDGTTHTAHRVAYVWAFGPVDQALDIDHRCHDPRTCTLGVECPHRRCVNPAHLEAVTRRVNSLRSGSFAAANARKTHCPKGHPFDDANMFIERGRRKCRICTKVRKTKRNKRAWAEYKAKKAGGGLVSG